VKEVRSVEQKISKEDHESFEDIAREVKCHVHKNNLPMPAKQEMPRISPPPSKLALRSLRNLARLLCREFTSRIHQSKVLLDLLGSGGGAIPVAEHPCMIGGERGEAWDELVDNASKYNKVEPSTGAWNLPNFPVAKRTPEKYRHVQVPRPLNDAIITEGHPFP